MRVTDIIMSALMVRAILREIEKPGTGKTETRRLAWINRVKVIEKDALGQRELHKIVPSKWQGIKPGDRIYVRENFFAGMSGKGPSIIYAANQNDIYSCPEWPIPATARPVINVISNIGPLEKAHWTPSIHMPRWASRLTLDVTAVKIERLQDISRESAIREGLILASQEIEQFFRWPEPFNKSMWLSPVAAYEWLWNELHGEDSWDANPEVVAITFKPYLCNVDRMEKAA